MMVDSILRHFDRATPSQIEDGSQWYLKANQIARDMASESPYSVYRCAAIIAKTSPRTNWGQNVKNAWQCVMGEEITGCLDMNRKGALQARDGVVVFGPTAHKTAAFMANILGDDYRVTVDTWAARVAGAEDADLSKAKDYAEVESAYCEAACLRGVSPSTMQAVTWVVARGRAE